LQTQFVIRERSFMNAREGINSLRGEILRSLAVLKRFEEYFVQFQKNRLSATSGTDEAMVVAQSLSNYYTCLETLFLRISQFFENGLDSNRWHQSLLEKMILEIPDCRPRIISDSTHRTLCEFLKFRHFTRYYFELDYDWDKLRYLIKKFNDVHVVLRNEILAFDAFLSALAKVDEE
jgi:hypothetical protein